VTQTRIRAVAVAVAALLLGGGTALSSSAAAADPTPAPVTAQVPAEPAEPAATPTATSSAPIIALTFDDGPSLTMTPRVLDLLRKHNVKATFFMQGSHVSRYPSLAREVARQGHVVGNHSYTHPDFSQLTPTQAGREITRTNQVIARATGSTPVLFRYPYGIESETGNAVIRRENMWGGVLWHWSTNDPGDFECPGAAGLTRYIVGNATDQALILLHDGNETADCGTRQLAGLDAAITQLKAAGYQFGLVRPAWAPSPTNQHSWVEVVPPGQEHW